jgi:hypothetical protein
MSENQIFGTKGEHILWRFVLFRFPAEFGESQPVELVSPLIIDLDYTPIQEHSNWGRISLYLVHMRRV